MKVDTLEPGDILHVKLGIINMGDGMPPWIPTEDDKTAAKKSLRQPYPQECMSS